MKRKPTLRLVRDSFPDAPVLDAAVARALLERVSIGELSETLRLARPGPMVAFAKQDANAGGYADAAAAARERGFEAVLRLAGGRAAVFHEGTLVLGHAVPDDDPRARIHERFRFESSLVVSALRRLGVDAQVGEVAGEYCPGGYSINAQGRVKLAGFGQRLIAGATHVGAVIVCSGSSRVIEPLVPVYERLGLSWDPATAGSVVDEVRGAGLEQVEEALVAEYERHFSLEPASLDPETLALARRHAAEHRVPAA